MSDFLRKHPTPWRFEERADKNSPGSEYDTIVDAEGKEIIRTDDPYQQQSWLCGDVLGLVEMINSLGGASDQ